MGVFPVKSISYSAWHPGPVVAGRRVQAPGEVAIASGEGDAALRVRIRVKDVLGSLPATPGSAAGARSAGAPARVFLQMRGEAAIRGSIDGRVVEWSGPAAAETFVRAGAK